VSSDGGQAAVANTYALSRGTSAYASGNNTSKHPVLSFRIKSSTNSAVILPEFLSIINTSNVRFRYGIVINPTIAGIDNAVWVGVANTGVEYDISRDNTNTLTGGVDLISLEADGQTGTIPLDTDSELRPGFSLSATTGLKGAADEYVVFVENKSGSSSYYASVEIKELT